MEFVIRLAADYRRSTHLTRRFGAHSVSNIRAASRDRQRSTIRYFNRAQSSGYE